VKRDLGLFALLLTATGIVAAITVLAWVLYAHVVSSG
jgi:hypothetical protein